MNIKTNSRIYKYLQWLGNIYDYKFTEEKSLCPLFWKTILATICLPFAFIVFVLVEIVMIIQSMPNAFPVKVFKTIGFCITIAFIGTLSGMLIYLLYSFPSDTLMVISFLLIATLAGVLIGLLLIGSYIVITEMPIKSDKTVSNFIGEGISAVKNRYCPIITWVEETEDMKSVSRMLLLLNQLRDKMTPSSFHICPILKNQFNKWEGEEVTILENAIQKILRRKESIFLFYVDGYMLRKRFVSKIQEKLKKETNLSNFENLVQEAYYETCKEYNSED